MVSYGPPPFPMCAHSIGAGAITLHSTRTDTAKSQQYCWQPSSPPEETVTQDHRQSIHSSGPYSTNNNNCVT
eukprot:1494129-Amphidinium_carterae.1